MTDYATTQMWVEKLAGLRGVFFYRFVLLSRGVVMCRFFFEYPLDICVIRDSQHETPSNSIYSMIHERMD